MQLATEQCVIKSNIIGRGDMELLSTLESANSFTLGSSY